MAKRPPKTTSYLLKAVPSSIWRQFAARVKSEGRTIGGTLYLLIKSYIRFGLPNGTTDDTTGDGGR